MEQGWINGYGVPGFDADPYVRVRAHETASCGLTAFSSGVISVNPAEIKVFSRGGCVLKTISADALNTELGTGETANTGDNRCLRTAVEVTDPSYHHHNAGGCKILIGGKMKAAHFIDLTQQQGDRISTNIVPLMSVPLNHDVHTIGTNEQGTYKPVICVGSGNDGNVSLLDGKMRSPHSIGTFKFHGGGCSDLSISPDGRYIITCGNLPQTGDEGLQMGIAGKPRRKALPDPCLKVFDIRSQRFLSPVNTGSGIPKSACFVRFISSITAGERMAVVGLRGGRIWCGSFNSLSTGALSHDGYVHMHMPNAPQLAPIGGAASLAPSGSLLACLDSGGTCHLLANKPLEQVAVGSGLDEEGYPLSIPLHQRKRHHASLVELTPQDGIAANLAFDPHSSYADDAESTSCIHPLLASGEARYRPLQSDLREYARASDDPQRLCFSSFDYAASILPKETDPNILTYEKPRNEINPELLENVKSFSHLQYAHASESVRTTYGEECAKLQYIKNPGIRPNSFIFSEGSSNRGLAARCCLLDKDPRNASTDSHERLNRKGNAALQTLFAQGKSVNLSEDIAVQSPEKSRAPEANEENFSSISGEYRQPKLQYSKLGRSNFDFSAFNSTDFAGLEDIGPNSIVNSVCQMLFFHPVFRRFIRQHLSSHPKCLATELRFLFDMLSSSWKMRKDSRACRAINFVRTLQQLPEARGMGIVHPTSLNCSKRATRLAQVLLEKLRTDTHKALKPHPSAMVATANSAGSASMVEDLFSLKFSLSMSFDHERSSTDPKTTRNRRTSTSFVVELAYPRHQPYAFASENEFKADYSFTKLLKNALYSTQRTRAWSEELGANAPMNQTKVAERLPPVLVVSANLENSENWQRDLWNHEFSELDDVWLPSAIDVELEKDKSNKSVKDVHVTRPHLNFEHKKPTLEVPKAEFSSDIKRRYRLVAVISNVTENRTQVNHESKESHYVANLLVSNSGRYTTGNKPNDSWMVFNDFQILETTELDTKCFAGRERRQWRTPCLCVFQDLQMLDSNTGIQSVDEIELPGDFREEKNVPVPLSVFAIPPMKGGQTPTDKVLIPHMTLPFGRGSTESNEKTRKLVEENVSCPGQTVEWIVLKKDDEVALDAEFVATSTDVVSLQTDGSRMVSEEARFLPARLSILFSNYSPPQLADDSPVLPSVLTKRGADQETLFRMAKIPAKDAGDVLLDDYIAPTEPVVDHLTRFSGIVPDDLNPVGTDKRLSLYKSVYLKLRALVDSGVKFIGHGLEKDFRTLNIWLPEEQIIDTVHLYRQPRQRILSLRWLAAYVLGETIQSDTHDSVEDARTALRLVLRYRQLKNLENTLESNNYILQKVITELYGIGRAKGWKIRG